MVNIYKEKEFLEPWYFIESDGTLERELEKEVGEKHILFNKKLYAIGRKDGHDDVLFYFVENPSMLATVHLTWRGGKERNSSWPRAKIFSSWEEWAIECMNPDNKEYSL
jgi:hypothetical protein